MRIVRNISKYGDKTGRIFPSLGTWEDSYKIDSPDGGVYVRKSDAEIILTEKRLAAVGERVLITDTGDPQAYENGKEYEVRQINSNGVSVIGRSLVLFHNEYEVIVHSEVKYEEADDMKNVNQTVINNANTVFEKKDDKYFGYKSRFGDVVIGGAYSYRFVVHYAKTNQDVVIIPGDVNMVTTPVCTTLEERLWKPGAQAKACRDEIVEQAKADVEKLSNYGEGVRYETDVFTKATCNVEFVVNRNKRTVVALLRGIRTEFVYARGIAKAAPSDCFNVHIGRAIALRRALGLVVPDEYLNAPQPTEVRVGDVIMPSVMKKNTPRIVVSTDAEVDTKANACCLDSIMATNNARIIDDSREGVS
ncbi:hypothetical protein [Bacillus atrophaeus]|uniref:hypothetical protein n=1 Tax=Bacillus atrophaeus TaxID=1452 RepID=UPI0022815BF4|nr:hypothetical protein [Bacillus atrophaeus]MCY8466991.1 hypothetical protein [Bacillus atrophaeus]MCY8475668.1 hypothetical protein [Bacillus atrophaeus]